MDPISLVVGAGLLCTGWVLGRVARLKSSPVQPKPVCMCGHHYGTHEPANGQSVARDMARMNAVDVWIRCHCRLYTGPQPVEQFWVPPAADMQIITAPRSPEARS